MKKIDPIWREQQPLDNQTTKLANQWLWLPEDIVRIIFSSYDLSFSDLQFVCLSCRQWKKLCYSNEVGNQWLQRNNIDLSKFISEGNETWIKTYSRVIYSANYYILESYSADFQKDWLLDTQKVIKEISEKIFSLSKSPVHLCSFIESRFEDEVSNVEDVLEFLFDREDYFDLKEEVIFIFSESLFKHVNKILSEANGNVPLHIHVISDFNDISENNIYLLAKILCHDSLPLINFTVHLIGSNTHGIKRIKRLEYYQKTDPLLYESPLLGNSS